MRPQTKEQLSKNVAPCSHTYPGKNDNSPHARESRVMLGYVVVNEAFVLNDTADGGLANAPRNPAEGRLGRYLAQTMRDLVIAEADHPSLEGWGLPKTKH